MQNRTFPALFFGSSPESVGKKGRSKLRSGSANGGRPLSPRRRIAFTPVALRRRGEKGRPPRLLNPSGAFNDPFYPQIRVKNHKKTRAPGTRVLLFLITTRNSRCRLLPRVIKHR
ncbi:MAG: hypothetical protein RLZZ458_1093 [Planctomycetota bacterium]